MSEGLVLTLDPGGGDEMSVTIKIFTDFTFPRERIAEQIPAIAFSAFGTPATRGVQYEAKHIWNPVGFFVTADDEKAFNRMFASYLADPRDVLIYDYTDLFYEPGTTRTRALAPGSTPVSVDGVLEYYAQFYGRFTSTPKQLYNRGYRQITFQLTETVKVPAT